MSTLVYGLHDLETLKDERVQTIGITEMNDRINEWNMEHNRVFNAIMGVFTQRNPDWNTNPIMKYYTPAAAYMQPVDEHGVAKPAREKGSYQIGLPMWRREFNIALSYEAMQKMTIAELSRQMAAVERADIHTHIELFLFALFYEANWTYVSTEDNLPDIPVKALANGTTDNVTYNVRGETDPQTADHYVAQSADIATSDPFPNIKETLSKYVGASANSRIVSFVGGATNVSQIKALDGFYRTDRTEFTAWGDNVSLVDPSADTFIGMGDEVLGEHEEGVLVVRWRRLPADYILSFNLDADAPIGIREDSTESLQGLFPINAVENSGNTIINRFRRKIGFAPVNRTGAMVTYVGNSATYAEPTAYEAIPA